MADQKRCADYVGVSCVDGSCPIANKDDYEEYGIPVIRNCDDCFYYEGCTDCCLSGTELCADQEHIYSARALYP